MKKIFITIAAVLFLSALAFNVSAVEAIEETDQGYKIALTEEVIGFLAEQGIAVEYLLNPTEEFNMKFYEDVLKITRDADLNAEFNRLVTQSLSKARAEGYDIAYMAVGPLWWHVQQNT